MMRLVPRNLVGALVREDGSVLPLALLAILLLSSLALSLTTRTTSVRELSRHDLSLDHGAYLARAGIEQTCADVLLGQANWSALAPGTIVETESFGGGTFEVDLLSSDTTHASLRATAVVGDVTRNMLFELERDLPGGPPAPPAWIRLIAVTDLSLSALVD